MDRRPREHSLYAHHDFSIFENTNMMECLQSMFGIGGTSSHFEMLETPHNVDLPNRQNHCATKHPAFCVLNARNCGVSEIQFCVDAKRVLDFQKSSSVGPVKSEF